MYFIYRFKDKDDKVLYVGRAKKIGSRMAQHDKAKINFESCKKHLPKQLYDSTVKREIACFNNDADAVIYELWLINMIKPIYNKDSKTNCIPSFQMEEPKWFDWDYKPTEEEKAKEIRKLHSMFEDISAWSMANH